MTQHFSKSITTFTILGALIVLVMLLAGYQTAVAQTFPSKPITVVVPYGPGTGNDIIARIIAQKVSETAGQPMVVDNRAGANGSIGADYVARATPDGHTVLIASTSSIVNQFVTKDSRLDIARDFSPVALVGSLRNVLIARQDLPANSMKELIALAKDKPGQLNFASGSAATHFVGMILKFAAQIDFSIIDYKLTTTGMTDVASGRVDLLWTTTASALSLVNTGKVKLLGVTGPTRSAVVPNTATMVEAGYPEIDISIDFFILAPASTPPEILTKLNREIVTALNDKVVKEKLATAGVEANGSSPEALTKYIQDDMARWARLVKQTNYLVQ
jgi:tripartite-type tricarboxylate transporter receptor subunit TctC